MATLDFKGVVDRGFLMAIYFLFHDFLTHDFPGEKFWEGGGTYE